MESRGANMDHKNNILTGGIETLVKVKKDMLTLYENKSNYNQLTIEGEKLEKRINHMEKSMEEEIISTIKKRKKEIEDIYINEVDKIKGKLKKIKEKRDKRKNLKVNERIELETSDLRKENELAVEKANSLLKATRIPSFLNSKLFYAMYFPSFVEDILIIIGMVFVLLLLIPGFIYFVVIPEIKPIYFLFVYFVIVTSVFGSYLLIGNKTKGRVAN